MTNTSDDGSPNTPVELPKREAQPDVENMGLPLELPDEPLTSGPLPFDVMILTADEQRRVFEEAGIPLEGVDATHSRKKNKC
jgi:hypothetical protein